MHRQTNKQTSAKSQSNHRTSHVKIKSELHPQLTPDTAILTSVQRKVMPMAYMLPTQSDLRQKVFTLSTAETSKLLECIGRALTRSQHAYLECMYIASYVLTHIFWATVYSATKAVIAGSWIEYDITEPKGVKSRGSAFPRETPRPGIVNFEQLEQPEHPNQGTVCWF